MSVLKIKDGQSWVTIPTIKGDKGEKGDPGTTTWEGITDKPSTFPPEAHNHDDRYYTESEVDGLLGAKISDPASKSSGQFLKYDGTGWVADTVVSSVTSVNAQTGAVVLDGADINVDDTVASPVTIASKISSIDTNLASKIADPDTKSSGQYLKYNGTTWVADTVVSGVTSVNTQTGAVVLDGADINVDDTAATPTTIKDELGSHSASIVSLNTTVATKADKSVSFTLTLDADDWDSTEKTLTVTDARFVTSGFDYIVTPTSASFSAYASAQICAYDVTVASSMTFHAETVPTDDLTVNVMKVMVS